MLKIRLLPVRFPPEAIIWTISLVALAFYYPDDHAHVTLCPISNLGFNFCPGCGLGRSIAFLFHGEIFKSWQAHPLGIFAVIILTYRVITLTLKTNHYGKNS